MMVPSSNAAVLSSPVQATSTAATAYPWSSRAFQNRPKRGLIPWHVPRLARVERGNFKHSSEFDGLCHCAEADFFYAVGVKILLTTTSFQDTPGAHHDLLASTGWEIIRARGPLNEADTLALVGEVDGYICGDDAITRKVLEKARQKLKVLSKYGIGVDKIDVKSCTEFGIPVLFTPGVNHTTVAEHAFLLLLALEKNLLFHTDSTRSGDWKRKTGHELLEKSIGIIGLGRVGKEVAIRARAFGMNVISLN